MKKHQLLKSLVLSVASLALIVPLGMGNDNTANAMSRTERRYYLNELEDPSDSIMTTTDELRLLCKHPSLRNTSAAAEAVSDPYDWDSYAYDYYARHFKQLYTPYLYVGMPHKITASDSDYYRKDERLLYRAQKQMGLLRHHRSRRHGRKHYRSHKHASRKHKRNRQYYDRKTNTYYYYL